MHFECTTGTLTVFVIEHSMISPKPCRLEPYLEISFVTNHRPLLVHKPRGGLHEERSMACAYTSRGTV
jgi:hypothetical protein